MSIIYHVTIGLFYGSILSKQINFFAFFSLFSFSVQFLCVFTMIGANYREKMHQKGKNEEGGFSWIAMGILFETISLLFGWICCQNLSTSVFYLFFSAIPFFMLSCLTSLRHSFVLIILSPLIFLFGFVFNLIRNWIYSQQFGEWKLAVIQNSVHTLIFLFLIGILFIFSDDTVGIRQRKSSLHFYSIFICFFIFFIFVIIF